MIWSIIYLTAVLSANYTAIWFIPLPVFGLVSFGTLLFGVTFTARDYAHRLGRSRVYTMITVAAVASAVLSFTGPVDWRVITASVTAIVLAEVADTELFEALRSQRWLVRVAGSNAVSIPLDSVLFNGIAFVGVFALPMLAVIVLGEIIVKFAAGGAVALWRLI